MTLEERIKYKFVDLRLLEQALTHKSYHNENPKSSPGHNERFEFLGDAVLDLSISDLLMKKFPHLSEGELSKRRAHLVNESTLAAVALDFAMNQEIKLGKGEAQTGGAEKPRLLASAFEALIGAIFLDVGFGLADEMIKSIFSPRLEDWQEGNYEEQDYKTSLQELVQERFREAPTYKMLSHEGPDHEKVFFVSVHISDEEIARGQGRSKKQAEQRAAQKALEKL